MLLSFKIIASGGFGFSIYNTIKLKKNGRKLKDEKVRLSQSQQIEYAEKPSKMIKCETVSVKGSYDDTEFAKLRETMAMRLCSINIS